ncbi:hypothetical protein Tco_1463382 [Tanacetum coccineum]
MDRLDQFPTGKMVTDLRYSPCHIVVFALQERALGRYHFIDSSLAFYLPLTWLVTSSESVSTWWTSSLMESSKPAINAYYSDSLLEVGNSNCRAYVISFPSGSVKIRPAPAPSLPDAPQCITSKPIFDYASWV